MANSFFNQRDFTSFIRDNAPARSDRFEILMEVPEELKELALQVLQSIFQIYHF